MEVKKKHEKRIESANLVDQVILHALDWF